jgi:multidrug transporter EmrE-like cation transporter
MQISAITTLSLITFIGTMLKLSYYKKNNPTFKHELIVKGITSAIVIFVGMMFYNEAYTWKTCTGIGMISLGLYLL